MRIWLIGMGFSSTDSKTYKNYHIGITVVVEDGKIIHVYDEEGNDQVMVRDLRSLNTYLDTKGGYDLDY